MLGNLINEIRNTPQTVVLNRRGRPPVLRTPYMNGLMTRQNIQKLNTADDLVREHAGGAIRIPGHLKLNQQYSFICAIGPRREGEIQSLDFDDEVIARCNRTGEEPGEVRFKECTQRRRIRAGEGHQGAGIWATCDVAFIPIRAFHNDEEWAKHLEWMELLFEIMEGSLIGAYGLEGTKRFFSGRIASPYLGVLFQWLRSAAYTWMIRERHVPVWLVKGMMIQKYQGAYFISTQNAGEFSKSYIELIGCMRNENEFVEMEDIPAVRLLGVPPVRNRVDDLEFLDPRPVVRRRLNEELEENLEEVPLAEVIEGEALVGDEMLVLAVATPTRENH